MARFEKCLKPLTGEFARQTRLSEDLQDNQDAPMKRASYRNKFFEKKESGDFTDIVGGDGPWQRRIFLITLVAIIPGATHNLSISFLAPNIDHWCAKPPEAGNVSLERWRTYGLPPEEKNCYRFENLSYVSILDENTTDTNNFKKVACDTWDYDNSFYTSTILSKWNMVCDKEWLVSLSKSLFMAGILVGVSVFGCVSDKLGRRPTIAGCSFLTVCFSFICAFSVSFQMFIIARFFVAVGIGGYYNTIFVLLMEISGPEIRSIYGLAVQFGWCIGFVCLPGIAYLIRDWFWLQVALTVPCVALLGIWWIIPESPRWLLSQGRVEEAKRVLQSAAKANNIKLFELDSKLTNMMDEANRVHQSGGSEGNVLGLLLTPGLRNITLNVYFLWFVNAFVYYGLSFNTNDLDGNPFINFALFGAVEFPAYFLSIFAIRYYGRRRPLATIMITAGISCILAYPLPEEPGWPRVVVSMIGKFCITSSFGIVYIFTSELFPTVVRNAGLGSASLCEGIGSIIAPFSKELGLATHPVVPLVVIGVLSFVSGVLVLLLPETHNCVIPNTLKEAAEASRRTNSKPGKNCRKPLKLTVGYAGIALQEANLQENLIPTFTQTKNIPPGS